MFRTTNKDNTTNQVIIQGARAHDSNADVASILLQNYDQDTKLIYTLGSVSVLDAYGNNCNNGYGILSFKTNHTGSTSLSNLTEAMRIDHRGYVGVGTQSPQEVFHVGGEALFDSNVTFASDIVLPHNTTLCVNSNDGILRSINPISGTLAYGVYGSFYHEIHTNLISATTLPDFQTKLVLTTSIIPAGTYNVHIYYQTQNMSLSQCLNVRAYLDDVTTIIHDSKITAQNVQGMIGSESYSAFECFTTVVSNTHSIALQYSSPGGTMVGLGTSKIILYRRA